MLLILYSIIISVLSRVKLGLVSLAEGLRTADPRTKLTTY